LPIHLSVHLETWYFIFNPQAGSRGHEREFAEVKKALNEGNIPWLEDEDFLQPTFERITGALKQGYRSFLIMGGDGTFHQAVNGVYHSGTPLQEVLFLFLPCGTGNDWRRTTGVPNDPLKALALLKRGVPVNLDLGLAHFEDRKVGTRCVAFINIAGMAYDAYVTERTNLWTQKKKAGRLSYQLMMFRLLMAYKKGRIWGEADNRAFEYHRALSFCIGCGRYNGNGMMQLPQAHPADGWLDAAIIGNITAWEVLWQTPRLYRGTHVRHPAITQIRCQEMTVHTNPVSALECEGEVYHPAGPVRFSILPRAWRVLLPGDSAETFSS